MLAEAGVKTNIHYVLSKDTTAEAVESFNGSTGFNLEAEYRTGEEESGGVLVPCVSKV